MEKSYTWNDFDEIFGTNVAKDSLEGDTEVLIIGFIELTLNHPRNAAFKRSNKIQQQRYYGKLFDRIREINGFNFGYHQTFEECSDGNQHLHAHIVIARPKGFSYNPFGLVHDIVRSYLRQLPKRYAHFDEQYFSYKYARYCSPSICCQFVDVEDSRRINAWNNYINKFVKV